VNSGKQDQSAVRSSLETDVKPLDVGAAGLVGKDDEAIGALIGSIAGVHVPRARATSGTALAALTRMADWISDIK
jgi:hypothetical protein